MRCPIDHLECHRETEKECPTKECTLGETSIPVRRGEGFVIYEIQPTSVDGLVKITLSDTQRKMIRLVAERGGEIDFDYGKVEDGVRDMLKKHLHNLVDMGIIEESPILPYHDLVNYHLTTMGRNLASAIMKQGV